MVKPAGGAVTAPMTSPQAADVGHDGDHLGYYKLNPKLATHEHFEAQGIKFRHDEPVEIKAEHLQVVYDLSPGRRGDLTELRIPYYGESVKALVRLSQSEVDALLAARPEG